jgi:hypothetical protein
MPITMFMLLQCSVELTMYTIAATAATADNTAATLLCYCCCCYLLLLLVLAHHLLLHQPLAIVHIMPRSTTTIYSN